MNKTIKEMRAEETKVQRQLKNGRDWRIWNYLATCWV